MKKDKRRITDVWSIDSKVFGKDSVEFTFSGTNKNGNRVEVSIALDTWHFKNLIARMKSSKEKILENISSEWQSLNNAKL